MKQVNLKICHFFVLDFSVLLPLLLACPPPPPPSNILFYLFYFLFFIYLKYLFSSKHGDTHRFYLIHIYLGNFFFTFSASIPPPPPLSLPPSTRLFFFFSLKTFFVLLEKLFSFYGSKSLTPYKFAYFIQTELYLQ